MDFDIDVDIDIVNYKLSKLAITFLKSYSFNPNLNFVRYKRILLNLNDYKSIFFTFITAVIIRDKL